MFKELTVGCMPTRGSKYSAGVDVYAAEDVTIGAGETVKVPLGIVIDEEGLKGVANHAHEVEMIQYPHLKDYKYDYLDAMKKANYLSLKPRSSLRAKGLISHSGVIDLDFKDELMMIIHNPIMQVKFGDFIRGAGGENLFRIKKGDKIGQLLLMEHKGYLFGIESEEERTGGIGSTGV